jgi:hypothetical protein
MATRPTRPKGYLTKGKTKSADAARKAKARQIFTPKGLGKEVLSAVLSGSPVGRGAKAASSASKLEQIIIRNMRKKAAGVGQRATVTTGQAKLVASKMSQAPVKRSRDTIKKDSGRGLSAREKQQVTKSDTITRPKPNKPKTKAQIAFDKKEARGRTIRKSLTVKVNPARPKTEPKRSTPATTSTKPKRTVQEVRDTLKGKKVKTGEKMRMDAQEYFDTRLAQKAAGKNPENSVRPGTREQAKEKAAIRAKELNLAREERLLRRSKRKEFRRDTRAEQANPNRYSGPKKEEGNKEMARRLADIGLQETDKAIARKAAERAAIGKTPRAQKKVDATLDAAAKARAAAARRNRIESRKITVRKKRGE